MNHFANHARPMQRLVTPEEFNKLQAQGIGAMAGQQLQPPPKSPSEVWLELESLAQMQEQLAAAVDRLSERLDAAGVLAPPPPLPTGEVVEAPELDCNLSRNLRSAVEVANYQTMRLCSLLNGLRV